MILRDNYFLKNRHKIIKVSIDSDKWQHPFSKTLVIPVTTSDDELKKIIEKSLGSVEITLLSEENAICLTNPQEKISFNASSIIDNLWQDGTEFSIAVYFSRKKTAYFTVVGDWQTTEKEIYELASFLCFDAYEIHVDEIGDCWVKRE